jgi:hypothetical protein
MQKRTTFIFMVFCVILASGCAKSYKVKPLSFRLPSTYHNAVDVAGAQMAAHAYDDPGKAKEAFGFDILSAGMLPVEVVFDNQGVNPLIIDETQTFLEDTEGKLWPILDKQIAHERAEKYAKTNDMLKKGAYKGLVGAAAGTIIGAAIGIVTGDNVAAAAGKGAAVGAAAGATFGGAEGYLSDEARRTISNDLRNKSLGNKSVAPKSLAYGFLFFPAEAKTAKQLRIKLTEEGTGAAHIRTLAF